MTPRGLYDRGSKMWEDVCAQSDLDPAGLVVLEEACRVADRLDRLHNALRGKGRDWLKFDEEVTAIAPDAIKVTVVVDGLLSEARQQQLALRQLLNQLSLALSEKKRSSGKSIFEILQEKKDSRDAG